MIVTSIAAPAEAAATSSHNNTAETGSCRLQGKDLQLGYAERIISRQLDVHIRDGEFTVIIGPNGCGKSTLLRSLARLIKPTQGQVTLDGKALGQYPAKQLATQLGLLPQTSTAPDGISVADLVSRGRYPHQSLLRQWRREDETAVAEAMAATGISELAHQAVDALSGGQRQRVWVAMALAQQTPILLLDEPTTYLDIAHQIELLELFRSLNQSGRTLVAVLHDLNHASRYATHLIVMQQGRIVAEGPPAEIISPDLIEHVFGLPCLIIDDPVSHTPLVIPRGKPHQAAG
ncbi:Ferric enterobactin transport ATP-binding protein FepC [Andreprevotia sp. IGB-42]|uniref:ABC transporter ATP-binding protein n=1 Tax=Andreprevotia sp. IGB-42 TaxID=2497473 RepID=UPI001357D0FA|nr:ABC transporter ATP-binding protein [Andreprevotia sp. IGB-42]KAF0812626.1 Ferric enterobactin transport ATP-binding protein FepC [Andreprevotia sp. IGB-42]